MEAYLSHVSEDGRTQTILEHLQGTAALCGAFAEPFQARELGSLAGMAHDIGKYSQAFQDRLLRNGPKVDHATAGAVECKKTQPLAAYSIMGHHSGLPDMEGEDDTGSYKGRLLKKLEPYSSWKGEVTLPPAQMPLYLRQSRDWLTLVFFIRMLYSCLVDADFLDTATFMLGEPYLDAHYADMRTLYQRLETYIAGWFPPQNSLNERRCAILKACMEKGQTCADDLLTLTVPTGGGKTVASLAFALCRALRPDSPKRRIIYVIPYTSIIEQTADLFRKILGDENVLEHHSGVVYTDTGDEELNQANIRKMRATENWDAPVIVTTAVQFFESLYGNRSSQCRKLHNIADSVVIFDEAQMLPIPYLQPCVHAISQLIAHYGVTAVLCTATQPALDSYFAKWLPGVRPTELCPAELQKDPLFQRVTFRREPDALSPEALAERLQKHTQALCIVNSRALAGEVYAALSMDEDEGAFHLSTLMMPRHRRAQLASIRERLAQGKPCRLVATSLVEAGVDVDFPVVYREEAGLDSILQAAGRCNREGKRSKDDSIVTIFQADRKAPRMFALPIAVTQNVLRQYGDPSDPAAIPTYFRDLLYNKGDDATDQKKILQRLNEERCIETVAKEFHLIENDTQTVFIPHGDGAELVEQYRRGVIDKMGMRQLQQYGVSVYADHFAALERAGDIKVLSDHTAVLLNDKLYSKATGLSLVADAGKCEFI